MKAHLIKNNGRFVQPSTPTCVVIKQLLVIQVSRCSIHSIHVELPVSFHNSLSSKYSICASWYQSWSNTPVAFCSKPLLSTRTAMYSLGRTFASDSATKWCCGVAVCRFVIFWRATSITLRPLLLETYLGLPSSTNTSLRILKHEFQFVVLWKHICRAKRTTADW